MQNLRISEDGQMPIDMQIEKMLGEQGRTLSNIDREMIKNMIAAGTDPQVIIKTMMGQPNKPTPPSPNENRMQEQMMTGQRIPMADGGTPFPDLTGDGQVTRADILKGRGVYAEGGAAMSLEEELESIEYRLQVLSNRNKQAVANKDFNAAQQISQEQNMFMKKRNEILKKLNMPIPPKRLEPFKGLAEMAEGGEAIGDELAGMEMSEEDAMAEIQGIAPQAKMIEQLVMAVMQMIQQGIGEQEIIDFLKEQGLDDEDIEDLFTMVMQQMQQGQQGQEDPIANELQEMS